LEVAATAVRLVASAAEIEILSDPPRRIPPWQSARLTRGARFRLGALKGSVCGYLAVEGGFAIAPVLGSQSTYVRGRIGGLEGRPLRAGDRLALALDSPGDRGEVCLTDPPDLAPPARLRVVLGPQEDCFTQAALDTFVSQPFTVTQEADRMGLRLSGPRLDHARGFNIVSDGIATGAIQVPGSGQPIVLLADHQTTGGYPKIATVISADLPAAGRLKPGDEIGFAAVSLPEAQEARQALEAALGRRMRGLVPASAPAVLNQAALYGGNLISGVVDGADG
jgi:allophanate hydrolase